MVKRAFFILVFFGSLIWGGLPALADPEGGDKEQPASNPPKILDAISWIRYTGFEIYDDLSVEIRAPSKNYLKREERANGHVYVGISGEALSTKDLTTLLEAANIVAFNSGISRNGHEPRCQLNAAQLRVIAAATQLEALDIALAKTVTAADLQCLQSLTKLRYLRLNTFSCKSLNFEWLAELPNLELLSVDKPVFATTLAKVLGHAPLQYLRVEALNEPASSKALEALSKCRTLTSLKWEGTVYLAGSNVPANIRRLEIHVGPDPDSDSFASIFDTVKDLESLVLHGSYEEGVDDLVASKIGLLEKLRFLWIYGWNELNDKLFAKICRGRRLERLKLGSRFIDNDWNLTDTSIATITKNATLNDLDLNSCKQITDAGVVTLAEAKVDSLISLALLNCVGLSKRSLAALASCSALRELTLNAVNLTDSDLEVFEQSSITSLWLDSGTNLTPACLKHLARLKNLQNLEMTGCPNISSKDCSEAFRDRKVQCTTEQ